MIFEPKPKENRKDLFDFEKEVDLVVKELHDPLTRLIVIKGLRRTGKSSILRVSLNESKLGYILIDMREFEDVDKKTFSRELTSTLLSLSKGKKKVIFERIRAVSFMGMSIELKSSEIDPLYGYKQLLRKLNEWAKKKNTYFVIAIDEAQELAKIGFDAYLAFIYDNLSNIKIVLTGSQVGVITNILDNPNKPLFGRARIEVNTRYLEPEKAREFLTRGFKELDIRIDEETISMAINRLNGVIGWLTLYGWYIAKGKTADEALEITEELGIKTAKSELEKFLETRGTGRKRYIETLKILAESPKRWKEIKTILEIRLKREIPNNQISKYLNELRKYGFITKKQNKYYIPDPLTRKATLRL